MVFVGLVAAVSIVAWWWTRRPIPPLDGQSTLPGLESTVEVRFDALAIPHVSAGSDGDGFQAIGYLQARDRLWQMELYRRAAAGRLSELLGESTLQADQRFLTLGLRRAAEREWSQTSGDLKGVLERYSRGVNEAMTAARGRLPLEFQLLRTSPEPWTPVDSLSIGKLLAWRLGENHTGELLRYAMVTELGPRAAELLPDPPDWAPTILNSQSSSIHGRSSLVARQSPRASTIDDGRSTIDDGRDVAGLHWLFADSPAMSNSWVISGSRTSTGRPLLANDPHLAIELPSIWWEMHLKTPAFDVAGVSVPGVPFVIIGHNADLGWGITNVGADVQDFFLERLDARRQRYQVGEQWLPLEVVRQEIHVRGRAEPVPFEVRSSRHGPVLNARQWLELEPGAPPDTTPLEETVLALEWNVIDRETAGAFHALNRARNWEDFVAAVRRFSAPAQNFVYADTAGQIGYAMSGVLPVRSSGAGSVPIEGWAADAGWSGLVDTAQLPAVLDPASGQIVTANNEVDRTLPYVITRDWVAPFRAKRILELLEGRKGLDIKQMEAIQADINSTAAEWVLSAIGEAGPSVQELKGWDRHLGPGPLPLFYTAFEEAFWRRTFADDMSPQLYERFYRYAAGQRFAGLKAIVEDDASPWFDDRATADRRETRDDVARLAAEDAIAGLRTRFGERSSWRWEDAHSVKFGHVLGGGGRALDWFFSRGPFPITGDSSTVNKTTVNPRRPYETSEAASYRQILDVGGWDRSVGINTSGQSGHSQSPHYFDQNGMWRQGAYHPLPFTRGAVEAATVSTLDLVPQN